MREMREPTWLVLTALAGEERLHGYAITQEVERLSAGRLRLRAGTLYAALDRLAAEGLVVAVSDDVVDGRFRRYYALSEDGRRALAREAEERSRVSREALRRLSLAGGMG